MLPFVLSSLYPDAVGVSAAVRGLGAAQRWQGAYPDITPNHGESNGRGNEKNMENIIAYDIVILLGYYRGYIGRYSPQ